MFIVMGRRLCARDGEMVRVDTPNTLAPVRVATYQNYTVMAG